MQIPTTILDVQALVMSARGAVFLQRHRGHNKSCKIVANANVDISITKCHCCDEWLVFVVGRTK